MGLLGGWAFSDDRGAHIPHVVLTAVDFVPGLSIVSRNVLGCDGGRNKPARHSGLLSFFLYLHVRKPFDHSRGGRRLSIPTRTVSKDKSGNIDLGLHPPHLRGVDSPKAPP